MPPSFKPATSEPVLDLRRYQRRVMDEVTEYLMELRREQDAGNRRHAAQDTWKLIAKRRRLHGVSFNDKYGEMETGDGRDLPNVCLLVPTGGGKTLLATQVIGSTLRHLLPEREGGAWCYGWFPRKAFTTKPFRPCATPPICITAPLKT